MVHNKSLDVPLRFIASLLADVQTQHSKVFTPKALKQTVVKLNARCACEGISFLTKTLPRLGKALDRVLSSTTSLNATSLGFEAYPGCQFPRFLGELFSQVLDPSGSVLPTPCHVSIKSLRQILFVFYKYELPYDLDQEQAVISKFERTEHDLYDLDQNLQLFAEDLSANPRVRPPNMADVHWRLVRRARILLSRLFSTFDVMDIHPKHGPGTVSTKEQLWTKYTWTNIPDRITSQYPLDAYFYASLGHVCDSLQEIQSLTTHEQSAKVLLVPKDSRGPRLISCEPLAFQWIQQGLGRAIVRHVEQHPLTRCRVNFTDQQPNRLAALYGSLTGRYSTLDLNEASDRVSVGLVRLLFPEPLLAALLACRSLSTVLPDGREIKLTKFAPMGSALCFPILALSVWALLSAGTTDADTRERILVYGDDVVVPTAYAENAMTLLECYGLKINRDKSCTNGLFRESCGLDAYGGTEVTPVRFRTVWQPSPSPDVYVSYIAYANELYHRCYYNAYELIVGELFRIYGDIPETSMKLSCPSLIEVPEVYRPKKRRVNKSLQKLEWRVRDVRSRPIVKEIDGWKMLLRYFAESTSDTPSPWTNDKPRRCGVAESPLQMRAPFSVSSYTKRRANLFAWCWR
jgi:hypothetical protein